MMFYDFFFLPKYQILIFEGRFIQMTGGKKTMGENHHEPSKMW